MLTWLSIMPSRIQQIARELAEGSCRASTCPELSALAALRGDLAALHAELVEECAFSMGNSARRLEASLEVLTGLNEELGRLGEADEWRRAELVARFNSQREELLLRLHYLRIQRVAQKAERTCSPGIG